MGNHFCHYLSQPASPTPTRMNAVLAMSEQALSFAEAYLAKAPPIMMEGGQEYEALVTDLACNKRSVDGVPLWLTRFDVWGDRARPSRQPVARCRAGSHAAFRRRPPFFRCDDDRNRRDLLLGDLESGGTAGGDICVGRRRGAGRSSKDLCANCLRQSRNCRDDCPRDRSSNPDFLDRSSMLCREGRETAIKINLPAVTCPASLVA